MARGRRPAYIGCSVEGCGKAHRAKGLCSSHWNQAHGGAHQRYEIVCILCSKRHHSTRKAGRFCSLLCRDVWRRLNGLSGHLLPVGPVPRSPARPPAAPPSPLRTFYAGLCNWCGDAFLDLQPSAKYCSQACGKKVRKRRRRATERGARTEPYARQDIFERDGWRCHICRRAVRRTAVVPDPLAPTIDHLIPIVAGGADAPWNVATAHFICNSTKGAKGGGEQLALIG